jgi:hypothetical protein
MIKLTNMECSRVECTDKRYTPLGIDTHSDLFTCRVCEKRRFPIRKTLNGIILTSYRTPCYNDPIINTKHPDVCFFCFHKESFLYEARYSCWGCITQGTFDDKNVFHHCQPCNYYYVTKEERDENHNEILSLFTAEEAQYWLDEEEAVRLIDKIVQDKKLEILAIMNKDQIKQRCLVILLNNQLDQMKRLPKDVLKYLCRLEFPLCEN